jgi:23S rRNA (cytidine1920-2'-O)/16S rRNA (cytidine1409-2'-O)-methyltransferase
MTPPERSRPKVRIDRLLVERGLVPSREKAQAVIIAGLVSSAGRRIDKPGALIAPDAEILVAQTARFVGRGGEKLDGAIAALRIEVRGIRALDVGASTGGFTDCLLQRGAASVLALDVGRGQLDWKLRNDPRVEVREGINIRYLDADGLTGTFDLIVVDVSFISLRLVLPILVPLLRANSDSQPYPLPAILALVKPQFEVGRGAVGRGGIVRDATKQLEAVLEVIRFARTLSADRVGPAPRIAPTQESTHSHDPAASETPIAQPGSPQDGARSLDRGTNPPSAVGGSAPCVLDTIGTVESPIRGAEGNREFFILLRPGSPRNWDEIEATARGIVLP